MLVKKILEELICMILLSSIQRKSCTQDVLDLHNYRQLWNCTV